MEASNPAIGGHFLRIPSQHREKLRPEREVSCMDDWHPYLTVHTGLQPLGQFKQSLLTIAKNVAQIAEIPVHR